VQLDPWHEPGIPLEEQYRSWKQRIKAPYDKQQVDAYTRTRMVEQQQQTTINWLNPADQSVLETTIAHEQVASTSPPTPPEALHRPRGLPPPHQPASHHASALPEIGGIRTLTSTDTTERNASMLGIRPAPSHRWSSWLPGPGSSSL
jgi:hypothetical protein